MGSWIETLQWFAGKYVVVTGAGGGIGQATAKAFAEVGATVIAVDRTPDEAANASNALPTSQATHMPVAIEFTDPVSIAQGLAQIRSISREIAILVNSAGFADDALVHMVTPESIRRHMQVNFEAHMQITQFITRMMVRTGGGAVVNISSVTAMDGNVGQLAYGASKAALISATRSLSMELASRGIRVNSVAPGLIDTPMSKDLDDSIKSRLLDRVSMGRMGKPEEVAQVILWLSSPAASYVTGQTLRIDGGMT